MESQEQSSSHYGPAIKKGQLLIIGSSISSDYASRFKVYGKVCKPGKSPLPGVKKDMQIMHKWAMKNHIDYRGTIQFGADLIIKINKQDLISSLKDTFKDSDKYETTYLYYSGHGDKEGNWPLQTSKGVEYITPTQVLYQWVKQFPNKQNRKLEIILDQCFAGKWFEALFPSNSQQTAILQKYGLIFAQNVEKQQTGNKQFQTGITIRASCKAQERSLDWGEDQGSAFTATNYGDLQKDLDAGQNPQTKEFIVETKQRRRKHVLECLHAELIQKRMDLQNKRSASSQQPVNHYRVNRELKVLHIILAQKCKQLDELNKN